MCGIVGSHTHTDAEKILKQQLHRGKDSCNIESYNGFSLGHCLHAIVEFVPQPLRGKGVFVTNCEIYNWEQLAKQHNLKVKNDSELLFTLLERLDLNNDSAIISLLRELDGVYAFAYLKENVLILARDILGEKPLWLKESPFTFASEKHTLSGVVQELHPRDILKYDLSTRTTAIIKRPYPFETRTLQENEQIITEDARKLLAEAVRKRIPQQKFGLLFSGGIDSLIIAKILQNLGHDVPCYCTYVHIPGAQLPSDLLWARNIARQHNLNLIEVCISMDQLQQDLKDILFLLKDSNVVKAEVGAVVYAAARAAAHDGCKVIMSGLGADELFAGYQRHERSTDINSECRNRIINVFETDLYRDDVMTMRHTVELRLPYLDLGLVDYALNIPQKYKIQGTKKKYILRKIAESFDISPEFAWRPKKAAQYGSNVNKAFSKVIKITATSTKSAYLANISDISNPKLCALVSGGKDSILALKIMQQRGYPVVCIGSIISKNQDSMMFHTPAVELTKLQAESMDIPYISVATEGIPEEELRELEQLLLHAKKTYHAEGVVCGALQSEYQRGRIQQICEKLSLKMFTPLWHMDPIKELNLLLQQGIEAVFVRVAAMGIPKGYLGQPITSAVITELARLHSKYGIHPAGEGGEYETLVVNAPFFTSHLEIQGKIVEDGPCSANFVILNAGLVQN